MDVERMNLLWVTLMRVSISAHKSEWDMCNPIIFFHGLVDKVEMRDFGCGIVIGKQSERIAPVLRAREQL